MANVNDDRVPAALDRIISLTEVTREVGDDTPQVLENLMVVRWAVDATTRLAIGRGRAEGLTAAQLGAILGMTAEAVDERYPPRQPRPS